MPKLPWACDSAHLQRIRDRISAMRDDSRSAMPLGLAGVDFHKAFGGAGALKTHEYLLMAGPLGKYVFKGAFDPPVQEAVFRYCSEHAWLLMSQGGGHALGRQHMELKCMLVTQSMKH